MRYVSSPPKFPKRTRSATDKLTETYQNLLVLNHICLLDASLPTVRLTGMAWNFF